MDTSSYAAVELAKSWLGACIQRHEGCAIPERTPLPRRVLDISNHRVRLRETNGKMGSYVALSHCWGPKPIVMTVRSNYESHLSDIPWSALSKTFQDCITFAWRLEYRYVWIDSLCIIQDDRDDWAIEASKMAQIFSNAQLTIAATRSIDGAGGCFSQRSSEPISINPPKGFTPVEDSRIWDPFMVKGLDRDGQQKTFCARISVPHGLENAPLLQRAWVFQEQILSSRILHFAPGELYWECKSYVACECRGEEKRAESAQKETRTRKAYGQLVRKNVPLAADSNEHKAQKKRDFEAYTSLVEQYMDLSITKDVDRLPALSGITFGRKDEYLAGMWRSMLVESLHWTTSYTKTARRIGYRPIPSRAPTWSWASMESPIRHISQNSATDKDKLKEYATIIAASCSPEGPDVRGRVSGGYLRIRGPISTARVSAISSRRTTIGKSDTSATLNSGDTTFECSLDVPLVLGKKEPAEVQVGDEVTCLRISHEVALVLRNHPSTEGAFQRVGILEIAYKDLNIFSSTREDSVFIL